jgi:hypothetical protein
MSDTQPNAWLAFRSSAWVRRHRAIVGPEACHRHHKSINLQKTIECYSVNAVTRKHLKLRWKVVVGGFACQRDNNGRTLYLLPSLHRHIRLKLGEKQ